MTRSPSFVLGYHGCSRETAERAIAGELTLLWSDTSRDWLGAGVYFWEGDPLRALEWANWKVRQGSYAEAAVIGAVIDLRHCLDLAARENIVMLESAYESFIAVQKESGLEIPQNLPASGRPEKDLTQRFLDCAVFRHLHAGLVEAGDPKAPPYDTVRGIFTEGNRVYPGSGFYNQTHVQIAVRTDECILGVFWPKPYPDVNQ
ncbi:hypothetical protein [Iodidimonas sp. SYSU 1G8]|uniref:hypothetical protein n=1 Tax=Iodidimonas sp. SYSU 1G8 TaxID=3133967 RepID=UPI0031FEBB0F